METKDGLTRDEAREAIEILILRKDNSDNLLIGLMALFIALFATFITSILALFSLISRNGLILITLTILLLVIWGVILYILNSIKRTINSERSKSKYIKSKLDELARKYGLEEFKRETTSEKEW